MTWHDTACSSTILCMRDRERQKGGRQTRKTSVSVSVPTASSCVGHIPCHGSCLMSDGCAHYLSASGTTASWTDLSLVDESSRLIPCHHHHHHSLTSTPSSRSSPYLLFYPFYRFWTARRSMPSLAFLLSFIHDRSLYVVCRRALFRSCNSLY